MKIATIQTIEKEIFIELYKDGGWWEDSYDANTSFIDKIVKDSFIFVAAFDDNNQIVGIGRALSDGCSDAYIQDVVVLKSSRGQGIGKALIKFLIKELKSHNIDWIGLIGEPNTENFYTQLGFKLLKNHTPMILSN